MTCPGCSAAVDAAATECPSCGIVLAKWRPHQRKTTASRPLPKRSRNLLPIVAAISGALALAVGGYWYVTSGPSDGSLNVSYDSTDIMPGDVLRKANTRTPGFDVAYELPEPASSIASDGEDLIAGRLRLRERGDEGFSAQQITDPPTNLTALTWNGREYVGLSGDAFTTFARNTLRPLGSKPAPTSLGCVAFDGESYWAATRIHPAQLYRLDRDFNVVATTDAPAACRGMAWDGNYLWLAGDSIHILELIDKKPRVLHTEKSPVANLKGIVAFKRHIWVTDSDRNLLQRLSPSWRAAWTAGGTSTALASTVAVRGDNIPALRRQIRSSDWRERLRAKVELQKIGAPIDFDRHENRFIERKANDAEVIDWSIELRDGTIYGSWKLWFGPDLLKRSDIVPSYTVSVQPPDGTPPVPTLFDAKAGDVTVRDVNLGPASAPGNYRVDLSLVGRTPSSLTVGVAAPPPEAAAAAEPQTRYNRRGPNQDELPGV